MCLPVCVSEHIGKGSIRPVTLHRDKLKVNELFSEGERKQLDLVYFYLIFPSNILGNPPGEGLE